MNISDFATLIDEGHEIEFVYKNKKYSVTYGEIDGTEVISLCEFYKDSVEVTNVNELLGISYNGNKVSDMVLSLTDDAIWIF